MENYQIGYNLTDKLSQLFKVLGDSTRIRILALIHDNDSMCVRQVADALTEEEDYDLMVMGRSQGQGCYCFVNGIVQTQIQKLQNHYPYIVVDNEAGMEHITNLTAWPAYRAASGRFSRPHSSERDR